MRRILNNAKIVGMILEMSDWRRHWYPGDEENFIESLVKPMGDEPSLCEEFNLDPVKTLRGYLGSLHLRKNWGKKIEEHHVNQFRKLARKLLHDEHLLSRLESETMR